MKHFLEIIIRLIIDNPVYIMDDGTYDKIAPIAYGVCAVSLFVICGGIIGCIRQHQKAVRNRRLEEERRAREEHIRNLPVPTRCREFWADCQRSSEFASRRILDINVPLTSLSSFHTYSVPSKADTLLKKCWRDGLCDLEQIVTDMIWNQNAMTLILKTFSDISGDISEEDEYAGDVRRYIRRLETEVRSAYKVMYHMHMFYHSPGGRNHYDKDWYWSASDLQEFLPVRPQPHVSNTEKDNTEHCQKHDVKRAAETLFVEENAVISQHSPTAQAIAVNDVNVTQGLPFVSSSKTHHVNHCEDIKCHCNALNPMTLNYLQTHKCWSATEYIRRVQQMGKKKVPGCYIIQNQVTGKIYVGQSADLMRRVQEHLNGKQSGGDQLDYDIAVLGHDVLIKHVPLAKSGYLDLNEMERDLIAAYDCVEPRGYNKTKGNGY